MLCFRCDHHGPPKPSIQTQFVLSKMDERGAQEDARYEHLMENLDLLFAQVRNISFHQQQMAAQFDINTKIVE